MISRIKGTRDLMDLTLFNFIIDQAKKHFQRYHFNEIETPILEPVELFKRALGTHTDVVTKEMYCLDTGPEGEGICLRPEATASTVRAFVENRIEQLPWRVFSWGAMFRHERPQKGRYRQFYQINIEAIGTASIAQDAFFIKMLDRYFSDALHLNNYALKINFLGCSTDRQEFKGKLNSFLDKHLDTICKTCRDRKDKNILRIFDCKNKTCQELYTKAPHIADNLCQQCAQEWAQLQEQLALLSTSFIYSPTLVRGLDYYNKTVFEFVSNNLGAQNALCGGGRYDQLVSYCGGRQDHPSIGAAMGIGRLMLLLEPMRDTLPLPQLLALHVIIPMEEDQQALALIVADHVSAGGLTVELLTDGSLKSRMRKANKLGAKFCIIIGSDEQATREVMVKNMVNGQEQRIAQVDLLDHLQGNK